MDGQFAFQSFSDQEIGNLKKGLENLQSDLVDNLENWESFIDDPLSYLAKFDIALLKSFQSKPGIANSFNETIRNILRKLKRIFNKCLACKIGIVILIYSLIGHVGSMIDITIEIFKTVLDGIEKWFGGTSKDSDNLIKKLSSLISKLTIPELALTICIYYGQCKKLD